MLSHCIQKDLHALLLISGMAILLGFIGYLLLGTIGLLILAIGGALFVFAGPRVTPKLALRIYRIKPVEIDKDTQLFGIVEELAWHAGMTQAPQL